MHAAKILGIIIIFCVLCGAASISLREKFVANIYALEQELKTEKDTKKKWDLFQKSRNDLIQMRKNVPRQSEMDELDFGDFLDTVAEIPNKYDLKKCSSALLKSKSMMASRASPENDSEMIKKGWKIIELLCKK